MADPAPGVAPVAADEVAASTAAEVVRITDACTACGACLATCPEHALRRAPKRPDVVEGACTACWACIEICPAGAIVESWASAAEEGAEVAGAGRCPDEADRSLPAALVTAAVVTAAALLTAAAAPRTTPEVPA